MKKNEAVSLEAIPIGKRIILAAMVAYRARRALLLEGESGVGKSEILIQVARMLGVRCLVLDLSLMEPTDLVGMPRVEGGLTAYAPPSSLPQDGEGILIFEELNRAPLYMQSPALQLLTFRRLNEYVLPPGWVVWAAINPEGSEYRVSKLDKALYERFLRLRVCADRADWLEWAQENHVHPAVLTIARSYDEILDDCSPRTWTYVSDVLKVLTAEELMNQSLLHDLVGGFLPGPWSEVLINGLTEAPVDLGIDVRRVLSSYDFDGDLQGAVRTFSSNGNTDLLLLLARQVRSIMKGPELARLVENKGFTLEAFESLLADLPGDAAEDLGDVFAVSVATSSLLDVGPEDVFRGFAGSRAHRRVKAWAQDPTKRHRVGALITALDHRLDRAPDLAQLRKRNGAKVGLGLLGELLDAKHKSRLVAALKRAGLQPALRPSRR